MRSVLFEKVPTEWDRTDPENPVATAWEERQLYRNTDIIGLIVDQPAELNEDGEITSEATYVDGVHVNIRAIGEDTSALESYRVDPEPNTPARVWA
ncbi:hypothetical protein [uncultured Mediterranean phage uvMED]|nr:hypothetical protein [uncultured Mediterranean phage uvMED]BAQ84511.1 hypothetical protein [uncultured Mediterranean phage uvMED]BAR14671.1 hypothetical protein [uncultured Mediterranean phage uvMED]BAR14687.1 hypothetical protein [uncultured Mediterranean phage uvMED]BAR14713.1 hypothetical protein [uncultured Mediterranean phage uvMED]